MLTRYVHALPMQVMNYGQSQPQQPQHGSSQGHEPKVVILVIQTVPSGGQNQCAKAP